MCKTTCHKITATVIIVIALALAITVSVMPKQSLTFIVYVSRFFDVMLPVLAVGALLKYLLCGGHHYSDKDQCCK